MIYIYLDSIAHVINVQFKNLISLQLDQIQKFMQQEQLNLYLNYLMMIMIILGHNLSISMNFVKRNSIRIIKTNIILPHVFKDFIFKNY